MRLKRVVTIALMLVVCACAALPRVPPRDTLSVYAAVESYPDGRASACLSVLASLPAQCGEGVKLTNVRRSELPFREPAATDGAYFTGPLRLTGTWTGSALALTTRPVPASTGSRPVRVWTASHLPAIPQMEGGRVTAAGIRDQQDLMAGEPDLATHGIVLMANGFEAVGLEALVVVGNRATIDLLRSRYKIQAIDAWLRPDSPS